MATYRYMNAFSGGDAVKQIADAQPQLVLLCQIAEFIRAAGSHLKSGLLPEAGRSPASVTGGRARFRRKIPDRAHWYT